MSNKNNQVMISHYKSASIMLIIGLVLVALLSAINPMLSVGSSIILKFAIVYISVLVFIDGDFKHGVLMSIFGIFTLGIWPYVVARKRISKWQQSENIEEEFVTEHNKLSFIRNYKLGYNYAIIGLIGAIGLVILSIFMGPLAIFKAKGLMYGIVAILMVLVLIGSVLSSLYVGFQEARYGNIKHGILIIFLSTITLGLWQYFVAKKRLTDLNKTV